MSFPVGEGSEPGLDLYEWEGVRASLEEGLNENPDAALPQLADLVHEILEARGFDVDDPVAESGDEAEIVATYRSARETADRASVAEASREDVRTAIDDLSSVYEALVAQRPAP